MERETLVNVELPLKLFKKGKVRDIFEIEEKLLLVATDRISAFDVVMPTGIPGKGKVLTQISRFWFKFTEGMIKNHLITADIEEFPEELKRFSSVLDKRSMLVGKVVPIPVECIVRGYLAGGGWKEYAQRQGIGGIKLPAGLKPGSKLPKPIFTPTTKEESGHDIQLTFNELSGRVGKKEAELLRDTSLEIYRVTSKYAEERGIIISDTKFEFGHLDGNIILIDELLTPDSSRFWLMEDYEEGKMPPGLDKQYLRDYLETLNWDKKPPGPSLPEEIVKNIQKRYLEAYRRITGEEDV
ncbi:MAG TPA: phosphoribosylaminoimidazolesuccinocarboxamide synthase [Candidatus Omnitrophica bacterium]|nr:phosphoribosylaminoimidazolesuccinocarboxamide synthase [Candidatus Omnitrophota bacterium]